MSNYSIETYSKNSVVESGNINFYSRFHFYSLYCTFFHDLVLTTVNKCVIMLTTRNEVYVIFCNMLTKVNLMFIEERHQAILDLLEEKGSITTAEIQEMFGVSYDSAKRDLRILEEKGLL